MRVLLVEEDEELASFLVRTMERDDHRLTRVHTLAGATEHVARGELDAILLDALEGQDADWCRRLRADGYTTPVLVLADKPTVARRVDCLDAGADDILAKPFAIAELRARIRALGRRIRTMRVAELNRGDVRIQASARRAWVNGDEVTLTAREWAIVELIVERHGRLVPRTELLDCIWGEVSEASQASLDVIMGRVRKKLGSNFIRTLRGEGYVLR